MGSLSDTAQTTLANLITLLLGITISFSMQAEAIYALEIMGKGMASIFIVIGILTAIVVLLSKITNSSKLKQDNSEKD